MNHPISICLEDCYPEHESLRFLQCTAAAGPAFRLLLTRDGRVLQQESAPAWCRIFVTGDDRLGVLRDDQMPAGARVTRANRHVDLEIGKPVILCHGDFLAVPGRCFCLHVHGAATDVREPEFLHAKEPASSTWTRFAAAGLIAVTGLAGAVSCTRESNVNEKPASTVEQPVPPRPNPPDGMEPKDKVEPIDVRDAPPEAPADYH
ncbi:hypothetical protein KKD52_12075 [Myxococcota bacterium]|nr:hypothetical protein [Myxococcota bacterium]MBU1411855.1 hypothetical protein [Myxococcota bacterium]MBU1511090.1 hypothetical protein [Myxococcota bacterium]